MVAERATLLRERPDDAEVVWLCSGTCGGRRLRVPAVDLGRTRAGQALYAALARTRETRRGDDGQDALLFLAVGERGAPVVWLVPIEEDTNSDVLFHRDQYVLRPGLSVAFLVPHLPPSSGAATWELGEWLDLREDPRWERQPGADEARLARALVATDAAGRRVSWPMPVPR